MSRTGNCWDNAPVESFFKTLKAELINRINSGRLSLDEIKKECFDYIEARNQVVSATLLKVF